MGTPKIVFLKPEQKLFLLFVHNIKHNELNFRLRQQIRNCISEGSYWSHSTRSVAFNKLRVKFSSEYSEYSRRIKTHIDWSPDTGHSMGVLPPGFGSYYIRKPQQTR